jgi:ribosomal protein L32
VLTVLHRFLPEGWIHAVYSLEASVSVNFWWNPIQQTETKDAAEKTDSAKVTISPSKPKRAFPHHFGYEPVEKEVIEVPDNIKLAKKFVTLENARRRRFGGLAVKKDDKVIPCQACGNRKHEYNMCPYLGHYEVHRIIGQMCCWENYKLKNWSLADE